MSGDIWPEEECMVYRYAAVDLEMVFAHSNALGKRFTTFDVLRLWHAGIC